MTLNDNHRRLYPMLVVRNFQEVADVLPVPVRIVTLMRDDVDPSLPSSDQVIAKSPDGARAVETRKMIQLYPHVHTHVASSR